MRPIDPQYTMRPQPARSWRLVRIGAVVLAIAAAGLLAYAIAADDQLLALSDLLILAANAMIAAAATLQLRQR